MKISVVTGSFDPITLGHLDIIKQASKIFDKVYVVAFINPDKKYFFKKNEILAMLKLATKNIPNVECDFSNSYACDYCKEVGAKYMVRGVRNEKDFKYENELAQLNIDYGNIPTIFLLAENKKITSTLVRTKLKNNESIKNLVPSEVEKFILQRS